MGLPQLEVCVVTKCVALCAITFGVGSQLVAQHAKSLADSLTHEWVVAYNAGQPDRLAALVRNDVLLMLPGRQPLLGRTAFRDTYAQDIKSTTKRSVARQVDASGAIRRFAGGLRGVDL